MPADVYWDNRPQDRHGQRLVSAWGMCRRTPPNKKRIEAFTISRKEVPCLDIITLGPFHLSRTRDHRVSGTQVSGRPSSLRHATKGTAFHMDEFSQYNLAFTLLHELSHSECWLDDDMFRMFFFI
jgi:hypothetical protein